MHSPSVSDFPSVSEKISDSVENFRNFTFSRKFFRFSSAKISDDVLLSSTTNFANFPLFSVFKYISPLFLKKYSFPLFFKISPCFRQIYVFFTYFICFSSPPTFTMMHLCITQCTYWTPLASSSLQVSPLKSRDTYRARNSERMEIL